MICFPSVLISFFLFKFVFNTKVIKLRQYKESFLYIWKLFSNEFD
jgi:hypothetical protein